MAPFLLTSLFAAAALFAAGFLLGARLGRSARTRADAQRAAAELQRDQADSASHHLEAQLAEARAARTGTEQARATLDGELAQLRGENERLQRRLDSELKQLQQALEARVADRAKDSAQLKRDLQALLSPLVSRGNDTQSLRDMMQEMLRPIVERERLGVELGKLDGGVVRRGELPKLLQLLAERGGFSSVMLSDQWGLPLATSESVADADTQAAVAGMLVQLTDRITQAGSPRPYAVLLRDQANQALLHRMFQVGDERYVLSAVSKGSPLTVDVLDPALVRIERLIGGQAWS